ncbi:MAG TPA: transposase [Planctomycetaceae bacterium]|nr:transposase [Planctomycetaceae bacterium]
MMPDYRRYFVPGGTFFFTLVTNRRRRFLTDVPARPVLGSLFRRCQLRWPFQINAIVLLPEHLHAMWTLPSGDSNYPTRWGWIKKEFTKAWLQLGGTEEPISRGRQRERRRGIWQPRFWEHTIKDEDDFERHFDYIHYNPVKHKHVRCPRDWQWSSFHRWAAAGVYSNDWACSKTRTQELDFSDIEDSVGEPEDL